MILSAIFHFLKTVFGYAVKIIAWLLVALSLWVPLVYSLLFIIVCGIAEISLTAVQSWFWGGLALSFIGSFLVSTFIYERRIAKKKRQKAEPTATSNIEKVKEKQDEPLITKRDETTALAQDEEAGQEDSAPAQNGSSLMSRIKQGAPDLKPGDTASKYNFISYNSLNGQDGGNANNQNGAYNGYNNQNGNNQNGFDNNQNGFDNNQNGFGNNSNGFSGNQNGFGNNSNGFNNSQNSLGNNSNGFNNGKNTFGNNSNGFSGNQNAGAQNGFASSSESTQGYSGFNFGGGRDSDDSNGFYQSNSRGGNSRSNPYESFSGINREKTADFGNPASDTLSRGGIGGGFGGGAHSGETPNVFATRSDPTILIYEYSDRLEYYRRTRSGLLLFKTRIKEASGE